MRERPAVLFDESSKPDAVTGSKIPRWQMNTRVLFADVGVSDGVFTKLSTVKGTEADREQGKEGNQRMYYTLPDIRSSYEPHQHSGNLSSQPDKDACSTLIAVAPTGPVTSAPFGVTVTQRTWANDIQAKGGSPDGIAWCFDPER